MCLAQVIQSAQLVQSAQVHQCQLVGGPIADEHRPKSELYSGKASVTGFLSWSKRFLIVLFVKISQVIYLSNLNIYSNFTLFLFLS